MIQQDYPYMYARVSAKKDKLYDASDYESMLKMGPNEISRKMGEGAYQEDIDELGSRYEGVQLVELALAKNLAREMSNLVEMADGELKTVVRTYLRKYDILTLKRVLRAKKAGEEEEVWQFLTPVGGLDPEIIDNLQDRSFEEIKENFSFKDTEVDYNAYIEDAESLSEIESRLDQAYYDELAVIADRAGSQPLAKFIGQELEYENLKMALRLKRYDVPEDKIRERLLSTSNGKLVDEVLSRGFEDALSYVSSELDLSIEERIEDVEHAIEAHRLENALKMLHTQPLSLNSVLGYVVAKIIEVKNLRMLLRAKETGIQNQETIRKQLVLPN